MCRRQSWGKLPYGLVDQRHGRRDRSWFRGTPHLTCGTALLLATLTVSFLGMPLAAAAQPARQGARVGWLSHFSRPELFEPLFWERLRELGYVEGPDLHVERRYAGSPERLPTAAQELARLDVDVIVARSATAAWHVRQATTTTPIVTVGDALVQARLVASLAHPGGTITGVDTAAPDLVAKRLQLLKEAAPWIARVAGLRCPGGSTPAGVYFDAEWREAETAAGVLGLTLTPVVVASSDQVAGALASIPRMHADGVFTFDCRYLHYRDAVLSSLPGMYYRPEHVEAGALMSYGWDRPEVFRLLAEDVSKILKGAKPADLPVQQPTKFTLLVNRTTAKALGLTIPQSVLIRAEVIQ